MATNETYLPQRKLSLEDVFCIACRCIYLHPVTLPCDHTLCLECFKSMVNITAYQCPICRKRISNWLRKYKQDWDSMVNVSLWEAVQQQYPVEVQKKLNDEDDGLEERIVNQGFTRVSIQEGEIKQEFDDMLMTLKQDREKLELHNLEIAKRLQEEEYADQQSKKLLKEKLEQNDMKFALSIQETIDKELQQQESDMQMVMELQNQTNTPKKGPLDKLFVKLIITNSEVQHTDEENVKCNISLPSSSFNPSTSTDFTAVSTNEDLECCTCGRLQDLDNQKPLCQFCVIQIELLEKISTQQKMDFLMAKDLEKELNVENIKNYNLRKRSSPLQKTKKRSISTRSVFAKKIKKLSKGQLTLNQMLDC